MMKSGLIHILSAAVAVLMLFGCFSAMGESAELFEYRIQDNGSILITGYRGTDTELVIPETIDGLPVNGISGSFGFNTPSIKNLTCIELPKTMISIEPGALEFAEYLAEIRVDPEHPVFSFSDGVLYNREKQSIVLYLQKNTAEHFDVPEGIRELEDKAFVRSGLRSVSLPESMERIGCECFNQSALLAEADLGKGLKTIATDAFTNCDRLKEILIPASVTDIGEGAFTDNRLREIRVDQENPYFTVTDGVLINTREHAVIAYPTQREASTCSVPEGITRIGRFAFYRSHFLKQVFLPKGLQEIGRGAFVSCNHITDLSLPDSVTLLEKQAFEGNSDLKKLHLPSGLKEIDNNFNQIGITELEIPEGIETIDASFKSLEHLTEVVIPDGVQHIRNNAFAFCKQLRKITIPESVTEIGSNFIGCAADLTVQAESGSYAEEYCQEHGIQCE